MAAENWPQKRWREKLAEERAYFMLAENVRTEVWAHLLDATSGRELAKHLVRKLPKEALYQIVEDWLSHQDFAEAMEGVCGDDR
jgi:hypothetical protein